MKRNALPGTVIALVALAMVAVAIMIATGWWWLLTVVVGAVAGVVWAFDYEWNVRY